MKRLIDEKIFPLLIFILFWQIICYLNIFNAKILPSPIIIGSALFSLIIHGNILSDALVSIQRVIIGFSLAILLGVPIGLISGYNKKISELITPALEILRPIPPIAWTPLAILWFGLGNSPAYFLVFLGSFFPIFTNTLLGIISTDEIYIKVARSLGATKKQIIFSVLLPSAFPAIFSGIKIGFGFGWMALVAAELIGAQSGLGYMIQLNRFLLETPNVISGMIVIGIIGLLGNNLLNFLEHKLMPWKNGV